MAPIPKKVEFPTTRNTAQERGQALAYWIQENRDPTNGRPWNQTSFALYTGIARPTLARYIEGAHDWANASQDMVERLLTGMNMPDLEARDYFGIPKKSWDTWRTFRPAPLGHGAAEAPSEQQRVVELVDGLKGEIAVSSTSGLSMIVDRTIKTGLVVTRMGDSLWVMKQDSPTAALPGEVLGGFTRLYARTV
jgi:hypothetical protein